MTYCLGMRCADGLIGIADTRLTSGEIDYVVTGKKIFLFKENKNAFFIMVSGLKSLSDTLIVYLNERKKQLLAPKKIYEGVDFAVEVMREVRDREEPWLNRGQMDFNLHCIVGGQYEEDRSCQLFRIYPEGSWTRVRRDTPFESIGEVKYGKAVLDRLFTSETPIDKALLLGLVSFDSTWRSSPMVHPPIDVIEYRLDTFTFKHTRLLEKDFHLLRSEWEKGLSDLLEKASAKKFDFFQDKVKTKKRRKK